MSEMLDVYARPEDLEESNAQLDADAIRDTPYQGPLPSAERSSGIKFSHENAAAWQILSEELPEEEYEALKNSVIEVVGDFEEKTPEDVTEDE